MQSGSSGVGAGGGSWTVGSCPVVVERETQLAFLGRIETDASIGYRQLQPAVQPPNRDLCLVGARMAGNIAQRFLCYTKQ